MRNYKSSGLLWLTEQGLGACVPAFAWLTLAQWRQEPQLQLARLREQFAGCRVAVRSDRCGEGVAPAGACLSVVDVAVDHAGALENAIARVVASYSAPDPEDRVLIQIFVDAADACGVAASRALPRGQPYQTLTWLKQARNGQVTGALSQCWSAYQSANAGVDPGPWGPLLQQLGSVLQQLQARAGSEVEIEWLWKQQRLSLVQIRPLQITPNQQQDQDFSRALGSARHQLQRICMAQDPGELLGLMPDWNPAELLGEHPRPLARSLFETLIGNRTWSRARAAMGYAAVSGPLLRVIGGRPYVRVARSLASLLPAGLEREQRDALVNAQLQRLRTHPEHHDKLEFEIACSSYEFGRCWRTRYGALDAGTLAALERALQEMAPSLLDASALALAYQRARFALRAQLQWPAPSAPLREWRRVLKRLREHYALPFAQAARRCFAYEALLQSALPLGALQAPDLEHLRASAGTLARTLGSAHGEAARWRDALRPGTFEIAYPCYGDWLAHGAVLPPEPPAREHLSLAASRRMGLQRLCTAHELGIDADALLHGFTLAHQARDWCKLALAVELSAGLERLNEMAASRGHGRAQLSWLQLDDLDDARLATWAQRADLRQRRHAADSLLRMPLLLDGACDLRRVISSPGRPTYLGRGRVHAPVVAIGPESVPEQLLPGSVAVLERCEPGFDWVFGRRPAAIVTAFGGPNAHVALRAHELNCPALLGIGLDALVQLSAHPAIEIEFDQGWWHPAPLPRLIRSA